MAESHPFVFGTGKMKKTVKAVTLVEMLIVVLLISVLTFIAVPRMGMATVFKGKAQTAAEQIAAAVRLCRTMAISNAAQNQQGFRLAFTGSGGYTGFEIINLKTSQTIKTETLPTGITYSGTTGFSFNPLGSRTDTGGNLTVSAGGKNFVISVVGTTGMVKCQPQ